MMTVSDVINKARAEVGTKESPAGSNCVKYNDWFYGRKVAGSSYPWCMAFISWLFNGTGAFPKSASCANTAQWFKDHNQWFHQPRIGDLVFFKFGTNNRWTNHVGLVIGVNGNSITTIEGNTSRTSDDNGGCVMERSRSKNIVGYGRPTYKEVTGSILPTLKYGDNNSFVLAWQNYLNTQGYRLEADGIFGPKTRDAIKNWQRMNGLNVTGKITNIEWHKIGVR